jgi:NADPH:quinone reductase-like Zn-dependent oxidoreductase
MSGPFRPRHHILGSDIAGQVATTGPGATLFRAGDDVFADVLIHMGGFAEYACVPESALSRMLCQAGKIAAVIDRRFEGTSLADDGPPASAPAVPVLTIAPGSN